MSTEEHILKAAEIEFLEKGYHKSKISNIAKRAEVNHALVHYYFRTKENLFSIVFQNKVELLADRLSSFSPEKDFLSQLDQVIEYHFEFLRENPNLLFFLLHEISTDLNQLETLRNILLPRINKVYEGVENAIQREVAAGRIKPTTTIDLLMNMVSMNAVSFIYIQVQRKLATKTEKELEQFLDQRKRVVKETIINSIKI